jgi:hypothetical protein
MRAQLASDDLPKDRSGSWFGGLGEGDRRQEGWAGGQTGWATV